MCGLTGIFDRLAAVRSDQGALRRMTAAISHRGPDGDGFHFEPGVGLGHRRLAIIDIGGGDQPMYNEDRTVAIVFNGEIYNHEELRPRLRGAGPRLPQPLRHRGHHSRLGELGCRAASHRLRHVRLRALGRQRGRAFLARDRLGKKPLLLCGARRRPVCFRLRAASPDGAARNCPGGSTGARSTTSSPMATCPTPTPSMKASHRLPAAHYMLLRARRSGAGRSATGAPPRAGADRRGGGDAELRRAAGAATPKRLIADVPSARFCPAASISGAPLPSRPGCMTGRSRPSPSAFRGAADERPLSPDWFAPVRHRAPR